MISIRHRGNLNKTEKFFERARKANYIKILQKYGQEGVRKLSLATPIDTGLTSASWEYVIERTSKGAIIKWVNNHVVNGASIAILIQYGHATKDGGYVQGIDYINPAMKDTFEQITQDIIREVNSL